MPLYFNRRNALATLANTTPQKLALEPLKTMLAEAQTRIEQDFWQHRKGYTTATDIAKLSDQLIRTLGDTLLAHNPDAATLAIVATGGYGRALLAPHSDIDLLFLVEDKTPHAPFIENMLTALWDLGFKVGHAVRTPQELRTIAAQEGTVATALLDARFLWGNQKFFAKSWHTFFKKNIANDPPAFIALKTAEQSERHRKFGDAAALVEPQVKEAKGALRDIHTIQWLMRALSPRGNMNEAVLLGYLTAKELQDLERAEKFFLSVRCALHYLQKKPQETLVFALQPDIAARFGYLQKGTQKPVDRLMKHYHLQAQRVIAIAQAVTARISLSKNAPEKPHRSFSFSPFSSTPKLPEPFQQTGNYITIGDTKKATENLSCLANSFLVAANKELLLHPHLLTFIKKNARLVAASPAVLQQSHAYFLELLQHPQAETYLRQMRESNLLSVLVPAFKTLIGLMQYDMYHVYTADEHTLFAVGLLQKLLHGGLKDQFPIASSLTDKIHLKRALCAAVFLHDIAKGRGGDHSLLGAALALEYCPKWGMTPQETEMTAWLVENHLLMSTFALKRDCNDPDTVQTFAKTVQSLEKLRLLLMLTVVDIKATNPKLLNTWKISLLRDLYFAAEDVLSAGMLTVGREKRLLSAKTALQNSLAEWRDEDKRYWVAAMPDAYWLTFTFEQQQRHFDLLRYKRIPLSQPVLAFSNNDARSVTEITVCTEDRPGLFAFLAGNFALHQMNIVDAQILTLANDLVLDTFYIQGQNRTVLYEDQAGRLLEKIRVMLGSSLATQRAMMQSFERKNTDNVPLQVLFDNVTSSTHTIIEITTTDQTGLLYTLATCLWDQKVQIVRAKISTFGQTAIDTFYVRDSYGMQITNKEKQELLTIALEKALRG
jgi:[protein-PII] uridylyltransferase